MTVECVRYLVGWCLAFSIKQEHYEEKQGEDDAVIPKAPLQRIPLDAFSILFSLGFFPPVFLKFLSPMSLRVRRIELRLQFTSRLIS